ncbi:hypothetical protein AGMMS50256_00830 [Betaproteobacteria bacterium]|nr:hypothetical protein AGMMS50256_00830 [Betaproteobacteria bacterium]
MVGKRNQLRRQGISVGEIALELMTTVFTALKDLQKIGFVHRVMQTASIDMPDLMRVSHTSTPPEIASPVQRLPRGGVPLCGI